MTPLSCELTPLSCELTPLVEGSLPAYSGTPAISTPPPYTQPADQQETGPPYFYLTPSPRSQGVQ